MNKQINSNLLMVFKDWRYSLLGVSIFLFFQIIFYAFANTALTIGNLGMIYFMKHVCSYKQHIWQEMQKPWGEKEGNFTAVHLKDLYEKCLDTETFRTIRCSQLDDFADAMGINY